MLPKAHTLKVDNKQKRDTPPDGWCSRLFTNIENAGGEESDEMWYSSSFDDHLSVNRRAGSDI